MSKDRDIRPVLNEGQRIPALRKISHLSGERGAPIPKLRPVSQNTSSNTQQGSTSTNSQGGEKK